MEWIETTGKSVEEAKEAALDELGVDEQDAEFEILAEPKTGLFGRMRVEARVRSRVRPTAPRPKDERRNRRRGRSADANSDGATGVPTTSPNVTPSGVDRPTSGPSATVSSTVTGPPGRTATEAGPRAAGTADPESSSRQNGSGGAGNGRGTRRAAQERKEEKDKMSNADVPLEEQSQVAREFLVGLVQEFGLDAEIVATVGEEDVIDVAVTGTDLGMLIGPKGSTLLALQDLTRSAVQQKTSAGNGRIHVDVAGYRQKRSEALGRFALEVAKAVKASGAPQPLEPMSAVDRKVIHDALTDVEGVSTVSEGEDTGRRVVVIPSSGI